MMKKILLILLIIIQASSLFGQQGSGTLDDPFYGTISVARTWNIGMSPVYVGQSSPTMNDLNIANGGSLTIDPGVVVIFTQPESDLRISGTGILQANGTYTSRITFTCLGSIANWGHIGFRNSTGTSNLTYCIIEKGYSIALYEGSSGGGIYANCPNLTISNCIIRNNKALDSGGGIYTSSSPKIENCLIYSNTSSEGSGGGGIYLGSGSAATVTNCTIVGNSALLGVGDDIYCESADAVIKNTIIWRSEINLYQIYFSDSYSATNLVNCGFVAAYYAGGSEISVSSFTSCIGLNISNTAKDGPNFINPTTDLSLRLTSPCRDRGTSSGTPGAVPPATDFIGNSRIGEYDMGAYETQYVMWRKDAATKDWNTASNWDGGVPTSSSNVVIPSGATNYPVLTPAPDFTIGTDRFLVIESGASVTLDDLINNGTIVLDNDATTSASLILSSYTRGAGGTENINLLLTGGGSEEEDNLRWHFISTPVASLPVSVFTAATPDIAQYIESRATLALLQGWVAYDGYVYMTGQTTGPAFSALVPGKGYDYFDYADHTFEFSGLLNTTSVPVALSYTPTLPLVSNRGFNLLGNPFHSGLDWDYIINDPSYPANTSKALYFTRFNQQCTYAGGVGIPGDVNGIIPPMQGFFNKTYSTGNTITLATAARTHDNIHSRYKGEEIIPLIRLGISENSFSDETVIRFDENAKPDLDYEFDAVKMYVSESHPYLYSVTSGTNYAINGQPFPEEVSEFPIVVNSLADGSHKITAKQIQGLDRYYIALTDKNTGYSANLKMTPWLSFIAPKGKITDRFVLKISTAPTGIENPATTEGYFNIYQAYDFIIIEPLDELWNGKTGNIRVMDLTGKAISDHSNIEFLTKSLIQIPAPERKGIYFVEIKSGNLRQTGRVVIK